jgi:hypothetical protein
MEGIAALLRPDSRRPEEPLTVAPGPASGGDTFPNADRIRLKSN